MLQNPPGAISWALTALLVTLALTTSGCDLFSDTASGASSEACKSTPAICDDKCPAPPILIEVVDATTKKGIDDVKVAPPFTVDGKALTAEQFGGTCKITADKARTLCTVNAHTNYLASTTVGFFSFRIEAPGHKGATIQANVPARTDDCCCPFVPATDVLELPPK